MGAMYELGALRALEEAVDGLRLDRAWSYVGVSAGSFVAACLANGLPLREMLDAVVREEGPFALRPDVFFTPAYRELATRAFKVPRLLAASLLMFGRYPITRASGEAMSLLSQALPVGVFDNEKIRSYLERIFSRAGYTDDFRALRRRLTVVAADLETGTAIRFGDRGLDHVPISRAVQASTAVPGVYPPVRVDGRDCVDGVLLKTVHASVALDHGARLVICINPLVPVDVTAAVHAGRVPEHVLRQLGLPAVLSQTFRTIIRSRLEVGISRYAARYPDADLVLFEPPSDEYAMFFANIFSFRSRVAICERGYAATRSDLRRRFDTLAPIFERHGLTLRADVLADESLDLWNGLGLRPAARRSRSLLAATRGLDSALGSLETTT
jgi:predicted acylesterase/phospholipase RssA